MNQMKRRRLPQDGADRRRPPASPASRPSSRPRPWAWTGPSRRATGSSWPASASACRALATCTTSSTSTRSSGWPSATSTTSHLAEAKGIVDKQVRQQGLRHLQGLPRALRPQATSTPSRSPCPTTGTPSSPSRRLRAGLDVYGEKPLTHSLREGRALCDAVKRYGRVWQTGSWQRSVDNFHRACELVRNGRIGKIQRVEVGLPVGPLRLRPDLRPGDDRAAAGRISTTRPGSARRPGGPYCKARVHMNWRWNMDYGGGQLMDWIGHHLDIAHWGLGFDDTGPVEIEGHGRVPDDGHLQQRDPLLGRGQVRRRHAHRPGRRLPRDPERDEVDRRVRLDLGRPRRVRDPAGQPRSTRSSGRTRSGSYKSRDHYQNFLDCVRSRAVTIAPGRDRPPLGERRPSRRHRHRDGPDDQVGSGHRDDHRRSRGRAAARPLLPQALAAAGVRRATMNKTHRLDRGRGSPRLRARSTLAAIPAAGRRPEGHDRAWTSSTTRWTPSSRTSRPTISPPASARRCGSGPTSSPTRTTRRPARRPRPRSSSSSRARPRRAG